MHILNLSKFKNLVVSNGSTILTFISVIGLVGTVAASIKATKKASNIREKAEQKKGDKLTNLETLKVIFPEYCLPIALGASTIACMVSANVLNKKKQASIISAYTFLDRSYKEYKKKTNNIFGDEADQKIKEALKKDTVERVPPWLFPPNGFEDTYKNCEEFLFYDEYSKKFFKATINEIQMAEYNLNRDFAFRGISSLNDFYNLLGLDQERTGYILGWSSEFGYHFIDFSHRKTTIGDGIECYIIDYDTPPRENFENPGQIWCNE